MKKVLGSMLMVLVLGGSVLAGCSQTGDKPSNSATPSTPATPVPARASFTGKSADGKLEVKVVVTGTSALVEMVTKDWTWNNTYASKEPKDPKNAPNEGHAIITLNSDEPKYIGSVRTSFMDLKPGKHTLKVALVNNDNTPINSEATVEIEVK